MNCIFLFKQNNYKYFELTSSVFSEQNVHLQSQNLKTKNNKIVTNE